MNPIAFSFPGRSGRAALHPLACAVLLLAASGTRAQTAADAASRRAPGAPARGDRHRQSAGSRHGGRPRRPAVRRRPHPAHRIDPRPDAGRHAGRQQHLLRPQRQPAHHPRAGRRPHPRAAEQRRHAGRIGAELRPCRAHRGPDHRTHRGAARPGGAALWRQRGGWRRERHRQPHPARAVERRGRQGRSLGRHRQWRTRGRGDGGGRQRPLRPACRRVRPQYGRCARAHRPGLLEAWLSPAWHGASATPPATRAAAPWAGRRSSTRATWACRQVPTAATTAPWPRTT